QPRTHARGPWRLSILAALGLALGACAPAAAPPSVGPSGTGGRASDAAPAAPAGQPAAAPAAPSQAAEGDRTVAAARQEGNVIWPAVTHPKAWSGGLEAGMLDVERKYVLSFWSQLSSYAYNANIIPAGSLTSFEDLLDPKWKGKIVWTDPRAGSAGANTATFI